MMIRNGWGILRDNDLRLGSQLEKILILILIFFISGCATPLKAQAKLNGIDLFGTRRITASDLESQYREKFNNLAKLSETNSEEYWKQKTDLSNTIQKKHGFHLVELSLIRYFTPESRYLTIDVVEKDEAWERIPFFKEPDRKISGLDELIALWDEYLQLGFSLQREGNFQYPKTCPAWHCTHGFEHPKLEKYLELFNQGARAHEKELRQIVLEDQRPQYRGNALFLLAHTKDGKALAHLAIRSIYDPSMLVRNNAIRILSEIALKHQEIELPLDPFLKAVNFPETTDRNKAAHVLVSLSEKSENRSKIARAVGDVLLSMLRLEQPNNHDPAYQILKNISGQSFTERDYSAWEHWIHENVQTAKYKDETGKALEPESQIARRVDRVYSGGCPSQIAVKETVGGTSQFYPPASLIRIDKESKKHNYQTVLAHETSHLCLFQLTQGASNEEAFRFIDEGFASLIGAYAGGSIDAYQSKALTVTVREMKAGQISLAQLQKWSIYFGKPPKANWKAYDVGASFIFFVRKAFGEGALFELFQEIGKSRNLEQAVQRSLGLNLKTLEAKWLSFLGTIELPSTPKIIKLSPENGTQDVPTDLKEIFVEFDQPMARIISFGSQCGHGICYRNAVWRDEKTLVIKVDGPLKPGHVYNLSLGTKNGLLQSISGAELPLTPWSFKTKKQ